MRKYMYVYKLLSFHNLYILFLRELTTSFKSLAAHAVIYIRCKAAIIIDKNWGIRIRDCNCKEYVSNQNKNTNICIFILNLNTYVLIFKLEWL